MRFQGKVRPENVTVRTGRSWWDDFQRNNAIYNIYDVMPKQFENKGYNLPLYYRYIYFYVNI